MKRRSFMGALAALIVAPKALETLGEAPPHRLTATEILEQRAALNHRMTVRTGLPTVQWRAINYDAGEMARVLCQTNEILLDMPWKGA